MKMILAYIKPHKIDDVKEALAEVGVQGMKEDVERACGKVASLERPRVEGTVNDEDDYRDEESEQIFMVACPIRAQDLTSDPAGILDVNTRSTGPPEMHPRGLC